MMGLLIFFLQSWHISLCKGQCDAMDFSTGATSQLIVDAIPQQDF
jgi:hypothetical protein